MYSYDYTFFIRLFSLKKVCIPVEYVSCFLQTNLQCYNITFYLAGSAHCSALLGTYFASNMIIILLATP